jgi:acyl carrier protein
MDYQALLSSCLLSVGLDPELIQQIELGAEIYGDGGLLDSVHLVGLIVAIEEALNKVFDTTIDLYSERGVGLLDEFKNANTLVSFLEQSVPICTEIRSSVEDR